MFLKNSSKTIFLSEVYCVELSEQNSSCIRVMYCQSKKIDKLSTAVNIVRWISSFENALSIFYVQKEIECCKHKLDENLCLQHFFQTDLIKNVVVNYIFIFF